MDDKSRKDLSDRFEEIFLRSFRADLQQKVYTLAEGEPATRVVSYQPGKLTLGVLEEALEKVAALEPKPEDDIVLIMFPMMNWRHRFPTFKDLITQGRRTPLDNTFVGENIHGIPVDMTPAVPYNQAWMIARDGTKRIIILDGMV